MAATPRRRLADRVSGTPTFIGAGTHFIGELRCSGDLVVSGQVKGNGWIDGTLTLTQDGQWEGEVCAGHASISGEVNGSLLVTEKLELRTSARIRGMLKARTLAVAKGAIIDGEMAVASAADVLLFQEKRTE